MRKEQIEARLLYAKRGAILDTVEPAALRALLGQMQLQVEEVTVRPGDFIHIATSRVRLMIAYTPAPFALTHFQGVTRPPESEQMRREILGRLATHEASLSVIALDRNGAESESREVKQRLIWEVVDYLLCMHPVDLVQCPGLDRLMTAEEAEEWLDHVGARAGDPEIGVGPARDARREIFLNDPVLSPEIRRWLDQDRARREEDDDLLGGALREFLDLQSAQDAKTITDTAAGRSAVYVMSATIALFALPVGAAMLSYNALSGGSLRASAYAMAGTGIASALEDTALGEAARAALAFLA